MCLKYTCAESNINARRLHQKPGESRWQGDPECILKIGANRVSWWLRYGGAKKKRVDDTSLDVALATGR